MVYHFPRAARATRLRLSPTPKPIQVIAARHNPRTARLNHLARTRLANQSKLRRKVEADYADVLRLVARDQFPTHHMAQRVRTLNMMLHSADQEAARYLNECNQTKLKLRTTRGQMARFDAELTGVKAALDRANVPLKSTVDDQTLTLEGRVQWMADELARLRALLKATPQPATLG